MSTTIMVTGGAGFIGSALVRCLMQHSDARVVNVDKLTYAGSTASLEPIAGSPRHHLVRMDVCDSVALDGLFQRFRPTRVVHLAAETHVDRSIDGAGDFVRSNVLGTYQLLEAARRHWQGLPAAAAAACRFLHVSTDEVYGDLGDGGGAFDEATAYAPSSPYAATKAGADHLVRAWGRTYGLPVLVTNCSNNYGPYQHPEKLIPHMIVSALAGRPLPVYGDGGQVRDWLFVDDHVRALLAVLEHGRCGATYAIGGDSPRRNLDVVQALCSLLERALDRPFAQQITFVPDRPGHDRRYAIDAGRIRRELGWQPRESFESGLERTVRWYLDHPAWWRPLLGGRRHPPRLGRAGATGTAA